MQLHDLLADLAGFDGAGVLELRRSGAAGARRSTSVEITSVVHDSRDACVRARCSVASAGRSPTATSTRRRPSHAGAVALLVEEWVPARRAAGAGRRRCARCSGRSRRASTASRRSRCGCSASPGTNGKTTTTYLLESIATAAGDVAGVIGTVAARVGDRVLSTAHTTPEATELQAVLARDARRRRRDRRDGGLVARARSASRRRDELRGDVLHQPLARSSRLSRLGRRVLRGEGAAVLAGVHAPRRGARR